MADEEALRVAIGAVISACRSFSTAYAPLADGEVPMSPDFASMAMTHMERLAGLLAQAVEAFRQVS